ncbi:MAG: hypothetical protein ABR587_12505 [Candidatus Binatia bacterium]
MSETIQKTLLALKDVQGTRGSFVVNGDGALLAMEMPSLFDASMFGELGPRIERFSETFAALGDEMESCLVRFSDHLVCIKQFAKGGALCVLSEASVNLPALRMAMNLAHKRLAAEIATAKPVGIEEAPAAIAPEVAAPVVAEAVDAVDAQAAQMNVAPPAGHRPPRYYRGYLVED